MKRKAATKKKTAVLRMHVTRAGISRTTGATISTSPHESAFREVLALIERARERAFQAVNTELIDLYWNVGESISRRIASDGWGIELRDGSGVAVRRNRASVSENGNTASVAPISARRKVFWCVRVRARQPESLCAKGKWFGRSIGFCE